MQTSSTRWIAALILSAAALLSFLARAFVDFRYVYAELGLDNAAFGFATVVHLVFVGGWIWALVAASQRRGAMYVLLIYDIVVMVWGLYTLSALCPSPCRTGWPVGEIAIWSNLAAGTSGAALAALALFRRASTA
jgi:hypothetical protein